MLFRMYVNNVLVVKERAVLFAEKSVAPRGTRMYEKPAELEPSVTRPSE